MERRTVLSVTGSAVAVAVAGCLHDEEETDHPDSDDGTGENEGTDEDTTDQREDNDEADPHQDDGADDSGDENEGVNEEPASIFEESFRAESREGFITLNEATEGKEQAREAGFVFPEEDPIVVDADIGEEGRWESTAVEFPDLQTEDGIEATVELPEGFTGELTPQRMTVEGRIQIRIDLLDAEFGFDIEATSEQSNSLRGKAAFEERPKTATVVDNEFTIDEETGQPVVDGRLGLPATESGTNWFELELAFDENDE